MITSQHARDLAKGRRSQILLASGCFCFALFAVIGFVPHNALVIGNPYQAGSVKTGDTVNFPIRVYNASFSPIRLTTYPLCACTTAMAIRVPVMPLRSYIAYAQVDTNGFKLGKQTRSIVLYFESGKRIWKQNASITFNVLRK